MVATTLALAPPRNGMDLESPGRDLVDTEHFARAKASTASTILLCVATLFTVLTYLEDAIRCITLWNEQLAFIAKHVGLPRSIAGTMLLFVAGVQLVSPIIIIPTAAVPRMAVPVMIVTCAIAFTVILQPILFNQLTNVELLTLSMAQLGACGIVFAEAHFVAYPRKSPFATHLASADQYKAAAIVPWIQLLSRVMLTVDLALVFGLRLSEVHPSSLSLSSPSPSLSLSLFLSFSLSHAHAHTHTHTHTHSAFHGCRCSTPMTQGSWLASPRRPTSSSCSPASWCGSGTRHRRVHASSRSPCSPMPSFASLFGRAGATPTTSASTSSRR